MSHWCVRGRAVAGCVAAALALISFIAPAKASDAIVVPVDRARLIKLPQRAAMVVIGNPLIADLTIQPGDLAVITAKGYGATNVVVLDKAGAVLTEKTIVVRGPSDPIVVVYRGVTRQTYSCTPECERRVTLGDTGTEYFDGSVDKDYFTRTLNDTTTRNNQTMAAGSK